MKSRKRLNFKGNLKTVITDKKKIFVFFGLLLLITGLGACSSGDSSGGNSGGNPSNDNLAKEYKDILLNNSVEKLSINKNNGFAGFSNTVKTIQTQGCKAVESPKTWSNNCPNLLLIQDIEHDGDMDLVISKELDINQSSFINSSTLHFVYVNDGQGNFTLHRQIPTNGSGHLSDVADLNGDGLVDLIGYDFWSNSAFVFWGEKKTTATGFAETAEKFYTGTHGGEAHVFDYDNDGIRELVSISSGSGVVAAISVFEHDDISEKWQSKKVVTNINTAMHGGFIHLGDVNNDGLSDFVVTDSGYFFMAVSQTADSYLSKKLNQVTLLGLTRSASGSQIPLFVFKDAEPGAVVAGVNYIHDYKEYRFDIGIDDYAEQRGSTITTKASYNEPYYITDINEDSYPDIVYAKGKEMYYQLRSGDGKSFLPAVKIGDISGLTSSNEFSLSSMNMADFNNDKKIDVAIISRADDFLSAYVDVYFGK